jgi:hypothetical protein
MSKPITFEYESQVPVQVQAQGQEEGPSIIKPHSHLQFKSQFPHYTPNRRSPMSYLPSLSSLPSLPSPLISSFSSFMRKALVRLPSLSHRSAASFIPLAGCNLGAGPTSPGTITSPLVTLRMSGYINLGAGFSPISSTSLFLMLFAFMFLLVSPDAFASLSTPFTTKLTTLSSQLELIGKSIVGVSVLVGIILSATGNPQWKMIITAICVGVAIIGFNVIKQFIGL